MTANISGYTVLYNSLPDSFPRRGLESGYARLPHHICYPLSQYTLYYKLNSVNVGVYQAVQGVVTATCPIHPSATAIKVKSRDQAYKIGAIKGSRWLLGPKLDQSKLILQFYPYGNTTTNSKNCLLYTSPSPRDATLSRMPSSA